MSKKYQCSECNDIITGVPGVYVTCSCGAIYVEEDRGYSCRPGTNITEVEEEEE